MELSVIIVSWNTCDLLKQCLETVAVEIERVSFEVETYVVDNASTDDSVQAVKGKFPWVKLIESKHNLGFAGANNLAIRRSQGEYVLLLNPDTEVLPGAFEHLVHFMQTNLQAGASGSRLLNPDGSLQPSCYPAPTPARELWRLFHFDKLHPLGIYKMHQWDLQTPKEVDVVQGAALLIRRTALNQTGLMDEDYFMYSEEMDLCYRLQRCGWTLHWIPQSQVIHYGGQSTKQVAAEMFLRLYESKLIFIRKHHGGVAGQLYKFVLIAATLTRLALMPVAWFERPSTRQEHLTLAAHYRRLLTALPAM